ncbi:hypothetical protein FisN_16Lh220 [Fistulifera solaris]|uniref:Vacuolar protein 8 n=1 Tax=Fistulifera solaris TaxID=1519565 RepID=A0A1Z5J696_FISSO|nr:hypothetical protein FisN_16Lh220 [Fistulifera solaris]|eukprot:GAX09527.1 hypothetical protein FisN_16Lh220 [Fistulifera solaris]
MTPNKRLHSTLNRHRSLVSSQSYDSAVRRIVTNHTPSSSATMQQGGGVPRSASSRTKAREERDSYSSITPRGSETVKQSPKTTGNSDNSKYDYSDKFFEEQKTLVVATASMQLKSKDHPQKLRKVVEDLVRSQGYDRRIAAISTACEMFDHNHEGMHNLELEQGAAHALSKLLAMAASEDEIRMVCSALEMVFRGSPKCVHAAYERLPANFLMLLLRLLGRCESGIMTNAAVSILNIWRIFTYLGRCSLLRASLCRLKGISAALVSESNVSQSECRVLRMRFIANIANCDDNKEIVFSSKEIVGSVLRAVNYDSSDQVRYYAAVTLAELASSAGNQKRMVEDDALLVTLVKMILVEGVNSTRESAITAIQNLSYAKENRLPIVSFKEGIVLEALKQTLLSSSNDPKTMRRAAGALTNLASEDTCEIIGNHQGLLNTLAIVSYKDPNSEVQSRAALALTKIANGVLFHMDCREALLNALVVASLSKTQNNVAAVLRVKAREPENREVLMNHPGVLDTLCDMCLSDTVAKSDRDNAVRTIMHLVNEDKNRRQMCTSAILDALTTCARFQEKDLVGARDSAIRAMERLAIEPANRPFMARHPGLLTIVASAVEREAEREHVGERSEYGFLAKPLLLSLLVAK